jgi:energy-coupling factor transporter ATP-binding protein EcfA2
MVQRLDLHHFKGFPRFSITFGKQALLVGPNNAGKSTVIAALRAASNMLRLARWKVADTYGDTPEGQRAGWSFESERMGLVAENLRNEFRNVTTSLSLRFSNGAVLSAYWPAADEDGDEPQSFFVIRSPEAVVLRRPAEVAKSVPTMTVVPGLSPVEREERVLSPDHVRSEMFGRLGSRHFRNQLRLLAEEDEFEDFRSWAAEWTPDFAVGDLTIRNAEKGRAVDLYCHEKGTRTERELFWAGDGTQIWLQLLTYLYRAQGSDIVVLDEPDLYLHADLQRRLVRLLEALDVQAIAASHSAELLVEASPRAVIWADRGRRRAVRAPDERILTQLSDSLGSHFNLRLARALRARAIVFVEGQDARLLRNFGRTLGARHVVEDTDLAILPLEGFSRWDRVEPFKWLINDLLERSLPLLVVLDRDYRTQAQVEDVKRKLAAVDVGCHVWHRKEIESYVFEPAAIARLTKAPVGEIAEVLRAAADQLETSVSTRQLAERLTTEVDAKHHQVTVIENHEREFRELWSDAARRHHWCEAEDILGSLNSWLQARGLRTLSPRLLAGRMKRDEIPEEMAALIERANLLPGL